jgi:predicted SAM-dependent methyltransferase
VSNYALYFAPKGCWNCSDLSQWKNRRYTHVIVKDVFEHLTPEQLVRTLKQIAKISPIIMCVIPIGDNGVYRIGEYHTEVSHLIAENEDWWRSKFKEAGWKIIKECAHVNGLKDNWCNILDGNHVFVLEYK